MSKTLIKWHTLRSWEAKEPCGLRTQLQDIRADIDKRGDEYTGFMCLGENSSGDPIYRTTCKSKDLLEVIVKTEEALRNFTGVYQEDVIEEIEAKGYVFQGNGYLDRDDPPECPKCGAGGYFYALWENEQSGKAVCINHCDDCGHHWEDRGDLEEATSTAENGVSF